MMEIGTHPLREDLRAYIGHYAVTWAAIEQTIFQDVMDRSNVKTSPQFRKIGFAFSELLKRWQKLHSIQEQTTLDAMVDRLSNASKARNYILHGIWYELEMTLWNLHPEPIEVWWVEQEKSGPRSMKLYTNIDEVRDLCESVTRLRLDLISYLTLVDRTSGICAKALPFTPPVRRDRPRRPG
jgi:hypothetical protein